ncbi:MAG TPA: shikimate dehydrogenase [Candidatus Wunengus sp. YC61]|uniref:shikimate dehydrogenase n=1 Tax=Candidatus Wunengus sp. YC61 TaxID=3367698 RepID=UPI004026AF93
MICIPIIANNLADALHDMAEASMVADIVELRIDYIKNVDLKRLLEKRTKPVIITNRPVREGGKFDGSEEERIALLKHAIRLQADYVDIEHDSIQHISTDTALHAPSNKTKLIVSYHNFRETPDDLTDIYKRLSQSGADIVKIVTHANSITDNVRMYRLLQQSRMPVISFCMGELGIISRILYKRFGSYLTFASLRTGKESAPGQISIHELLNTYQVRKQDKHSAIYGLIGNPVSHSISPIIHNTLFNELNFNGIYVPFKVDNIGDFIREFRGLDVKGYSVTIPHKESVVNHLDVIDAIAKKIGAVNTIVNKGGQLVGFNTDCEAAIKVLEGVNSRGERPFALTKDVHLKGKKVALVGAGGVARAIAFGLKERQAQITIINRNYERAQSLARDVGCLVRKFDDPQALDTDILINATPVGMFPKINETPIDKNKLKSNMIVFDTIYNPIETKLLKEAKAQGCKTIHGLSMFVHQAAAQFKLWTGQMPSVEIIENIAYKHLA